MEEVPRKHLWMVVGALVGMVLGAGVGYWLWNEQAHRGQRWRWTPRKLLQLVWVGMQSLRRLQGVLEKD